MVRKWSYLNITFPVPEIDKSVLEKDFETHHRFKVFRATTRFKKYTFGMTKIVRKKYVRRKRRTNLLALGYPTYWWSKAYLKERQFVRFYQAFGMYPVSAFSANLNVLDAKRVSLATVNNVGVNSFSLSRTILSHFLHQTNGADFLQPRLSPNNYSFLASSKVEAIASIAAAGPCMIFDSNLNYPIDAVLNLTDSLHALQGLDLVTFQATVNSTESLRRTLIYLTWLVITKS